MQARMDGSADATAVRVLSQVRSILQTSTPTDALQRHSTGEL